MPNIISKLRIIKEKEIDDTKIKEEETFPIGVYSENVIILDDEKVFSLAQLYNYLKNFFNNKIFSWYGSSLPTNNNDQIIDFYQIQEINN